MVRTKCIPRYSFNHKPRRTIGNSLSKQKYRAAAIQLLESLETDPSVEVILLTNSLYELAFNLFKQREDKEWGLVDCISFIVMQDRGITDALTTDTHFQQAGFRVLLGAL
jgi:hypothetical protein